MTTEEHIDDLTCDLDYIRFGMKYEYAQKEIPSILMLLITEIRKLNVNVEELVENTKNGWYNRFWREPNT